MNIDQILEENGLNFQIEKIPLFAIQGLGEPIPSAYYGLLNSKTQEIIHTVKGSYTPSQNREIIEKVLEGMLPFGNDISISKAGSLNGGRKVYIQLKIKGNGIVGNDEIERFITIIDSNDGSTSLSFGIGDLTMSCKNQFYKFNRMNENKFRHSIQLTEKMKQIPFLIECALSQSLKQVELYNKFLSTPVSKDLANKLVLELLGYDKVLSPQELLLQKSTAAINKMDTIYKNINLEIKDKGANAWGLHSAITRFTTHELRILTRDNAREESIMMGSGYDMNQKSLKFAELLLV